MTYFELFGAPGLGCHDRPGLLGGLTAVLLAFSGVLARKLFVIKSPGGPRGMDPKQGL